MSLPTTIPIPHNYPLVNITQPGPNDHLLGRGRTVNEHSGNVKLRNLIAPHKQRFQNSDAKTKPVISRQILYEWRTMDPPGRVLEKGQIAGVGVVE